MENGEEIPQHQFDPLLSELGSEKYTQERKHFSGRQPAYIRPGQEDHLSPRAYIELFYLSRDPNNSTQQVGHGHPYNVKVDGFSHGLHLVDNCSSVPGQRNNEDQAVRKGYSIFFCLLLG